MQYRFESGVFVVTDAAGVAYSPPSLAEFTHDYEALLEVINTGSVKSFSYARTKMLDAKFQFHTLLNKEREQVDTVVRAPARSFVRSVVRSFGRSFVRSFVRSVV